MVAHDHTDASESVAAPVKPRVVNAEAGDELSLGFESGLTTAGTVESRETTDLSDRPAGMETGLARRIHLRLAVPDAGGILEVAFSERVAGGYTVPTGRLYDPKRSPGGWIVEDRFDDLGRVTFIRDPEAAPEEGDL